jgi:hypothetical protein
MFIIHFKFIHTLCLLYNVLHKNKYLYYVRLEVFLAMKMQIMVIWVNLKGDCHCFEGMYHLLLQGKNRGFEDHGSQILWKIPFT